MADENKNKLLDTNRTKQLISKIKTELDKKANINSIPTLLPNPNALHFGEKKYDGTSSQTITANDLGALTSQDISGKADKATTLEGYGINNAYTKNEIDTKLAGKSDTGHTHSNYVDVSTEQNITGKKNFEDIQVDGTASFEGSVNINGEEIATKSDIPTYNGGVSTILNSNLTTNRALISNANGKVATSSITNTELGYLEGVTSNIQTQLNSCLKKSSDGALDAEYVRVYTDGDGKTNFHRPPNQIITNDGGDIDAYFFDTGFSIENVDGDEFYTYSFPAKSGTFAMTSDIPSESLLYDSSNISTGTSGYIKITDKSGNRKCTIAYGTVSINQNKFNNKTITFAKSMPSATYSVNLTARVNNTTGSREVFTSVCTDTSSTNNPSTTGFHCSGHCGNTSYKIVELYYMAIYIG